jgi:hypothetical protein
MRLRKMMNFRGRIPNVIWWVILSLLVTGLAYFMFRGRKEGMEVSMPAKSAFDARTADIAIAQTEQTKLDDDWKTAYKNSCKDINQCPSLVNDETNKKRAMDDGQKKIKLLTDGNPNGSNDNDKLTINVLRSRAEAEQTARAESEQKSKAEQRARAEVEEKNMLAKKLSELEPRIAKLEAAANAVYVSNAGSPSNTDPLN